MHLIKYEFGLESGRVYRPRKADKTVHSEEYIERKILWTTLGALRNENAARRYIDLYYKMKGDTDASTFKELIKALMRHNSECEYNWFNYVQKFNPQKNL